jgi:hypothetical protein
LRVDTGERTGTAEPTEAGEHGPSATRTPPSPSPIHGAAPGRPRDGGYPSDQRGDVLGSSVTGAAADSKSPDFAVLTCTHMSARSPGCRLRLPRRRRRRRSVASRTRLG